MCKIGLVRRNWDGGAARSWRKRSTVPCHEVVGGVLKTWLIGFRWTAKVSCRFARPWYWMKAAPSHALTHTNVHFILCISQLGNNAVEGNLPSEFCCLSCFGCISLGSQTRRRTLISIAQPSFHQPLSVRRPLISRRAPLLLFHSAPFRTKTNKQKKHIVMRRCYYQCASLCLYFVWLCIFVPLHPLVCSGVAMVRREGKEKQLGFCHRRSELWKVTTPGSNVSFH